jgi:EmrB/QacA subfamily drug resistance transporter
MLNARRHVTLTVALSVLAVFVVYLPITAVSVALVRIGADTGASTSGLQWVSDAYIIPMTALILSAGVFGDIHGRKRVYLIGMAMTALGATVAALAGLLSGSNALHALWAGQAIMGAGGGMLLPTTLALIAHAVPDFKERSRFIALWATGLVLGLALGPLLSGAILEGLGWGWIFVPVALAAVGATIAAARTLPESSSPEGRHLDWPGQFTATIAIVASIFGVIEGGSAGWTSPQALIGLILGGIAFAAFVAVELRVPSPAMRLSLFRSPTFAATSAAAPAALFALVGAIFVLSLFFGRVQGLSPLEIGVRLLFLNGVTVLVNPLVGRLMTRVRPMVVLTAGMVVIAVMLVVLSGLDASTGLGTIAWQLAILGAADALVLSAIPLAAITSVPHELAGMASTTNTVLRQYGGALGPAVLGVIVAGGSSFTDGMHTALIASAVVVAVVAAGCAATALRSAR